MISVVIPHYNNQNDILRAVNSVLNQTLQDFEIIIVDDFSKKINLLEDILYSINDKRIKLIKHKKNQNGSVARNTGVLNAKGEYIAFLDADDEWKENHLEKSLKFAEMQTEPCLIYSKSIIKQEEFTNMALPLLPKLKTQSVSDYLFCDKGFIQTSSFFLKIEIATKIHWNEELKRHQDYDYLFRLEKEKVTFKMVDNIGVIIHWENNNIENKGGTWFFSLNYAQTHKLYFSKKTYSCFILKNVVFLLLEKRKIKQATKIIVKEVTLRTLNLKKFIFIINYYIFGNLKFLSKILN